MINPKDIKLYKLCCVFLNKERCHEGKPYLNFMVSATLNNEDADFLWLERRIAMTCHAFLDSQNKPLVLTFGLEDDHNSVFYDTGISKSHRTQEAIRTTRNAICWKHSDLGIEYYANNKKWIEVAKLYKNALIKYFINENKHFTLDSDLSGKLFNTCGGNVNFVLTRNSRTGGSNE